MTDELSAEDDIQPEAGDEGEVYGETLAIWPIIEDLIRFSCSSPDWPKLLFFQPG